jgi:hypothetical protein
MTATKNPTMTATQLLARIGKLKQTIELTGKKISRQKCELWAFVYLYVETRCSKDNYDLTDCLDELQEQWGANRQRWSQYRKVGEFLRKNKIDVEVVWSSALFNVGMRAHRFTEPHRKRLVKVLNDGTGPSHCVRIMSGMGYIPFKRMPSWSTAEVKRHKHKVTDWQPELSALKRAILKMRPDCKVKIDLQINGSSVKV